MLGPQLGSLLWGEAPRVELRCPLGAGGLGAGALGNLFPWLTAALSAEVAVSVAGGLTLPASL